jgi:hypothetical protein
MTGFTPEQRFVHHKQGRQASDSVRWHGLSLVPRLYAHLNPLTEAEATTLEGELACQLRRAGFSVLAGHLDYIHGTDIEGGNS